MCPRFALAILCSMATRSTCSSSSSQLLPFSSFQESCTRKLPEPLTRLWGSRPLPDLNMILPSALWSTDDPNLAILPLWEPAVPESGQTVPFMDTHVAVRFIGGVSNFSAATAPGCEDSYPDVWCDLVVRNVSTGELQNRFDLVQSRLGRFVAAGMDVMVVLDNVPWAFVSDTDTSSETCQNYGCQYLPPDDPEEFGNWVGELAAYLKDTWGAAFAANHVRWRLGTEANGPRWSANGEYAYRYWECYQTVAAAVKKELGAGAQVGGSNWVEVVSEGVGGLTPDGKDAFQYNFYTNVSANGAPLDFIAASHYGGGNTDWTNFPGSDWSLRTPGTTTGQLELQAMRDLAARPNATLELHEWSILYNERGEGSFEPSSVGTAWAGASFAMHVCHGVDRVFHWQTGTTLRNSSGDGRLVTFYEQHPWNMAMLELFLGGAATFRVFDYVGSSSAFGRAQQGGDNPPVLNSTIGVVESLKSDENTYYALVAAVGATRETTWTTTVSINIDTAAAGVAAVQQWQFNSSVSVVETVLRELSSLEDPSAMLLHDDGLPYDFSRMLTADGIAYASAPENLDRYWSLHAATFQPGTYEGTVTKPESGGLELAFEVSAASVTVLKVTLE